MEKFEIKLDNVAIADIGNILREMGMRKENILSCHFLIEGEDIYTYQEIDFTTYFSNPSTCYIHFKNIAIYSDIEDAIVIISGDSLSTEITINFPYTLEQYEKNKMYIMSYLKQLKHFSTAISFGFEPLNDEDVLIYL